MPPKVTLSDEAKHAAEREKRTEKMMQTGRYDRKAMKIRLDAEEWVEQGLRDLWNLTDDNTEDPDPDHLDLDEIMDQQVGQPRADLIKNLVREAPNKAGIEAFATNLCEKLLRIKKL